MLWLDCACALIKEVEGCRLKAYPDPATGGAPWTIGYGATGPLITKDTMWTQDQADLDLRNRVLVLGAAIDYLVKVPLSPESKAALISFAYNVGRRAFATSTLLKRLNAGDIIGAAGEFDHWHLANGIENKGVTNRRNKEQALFLKGFNQ